MPDEPSEEWSESEKEVLIQKGLLFTQLLESQKFIEFISMNYDIVRHEEHKTMYVVEVPDEVALERAQELLKAQAKQAPKIKPATAADLRRLENKK